MDTKSVKPRNGFSIPTRNRQLSANYVKTEKLHEKMKRIQVFDENNVNVTPLPMVSYKRATEDTGASAESGEYVVNSSSGPFSRSIFNTTIAQERIEDSEPQGLWSATTPRNESVVLLTEADLRKEIKVHLTQTETFILFELINSCTLQDTDEARAVQKRNELYQELLKNKVGNDRYMSKGVNTFNNPLKMKTIQTHPINYSSKAVDVSSWDMYDQYNERAEAAKEVTDSKETDEFNIGGKTKDSDKAELNPNGPEGSQDQSLISSTGSQTKICNLSNDFASEDGVRNDEKILQCKNFARDLFVMERIVNLNTYQPKLAKYRDLPICSVNEEEVQSAHTEDEQGPHLQRLWDFKCALTNDLTVSCMRWNMANLDTIAIGYGEFEFKNQKPGLACCWSMKNPDNPEKVYTYRCGVTAIDFSVSYPNLLGVGFYDGGIAVYDTRLETDKPVMNNFLSSNRHTGPVTDLKWVEREGGAEVVEKMEYLISISKDGRVSSWAILKGFECSDLMHLRRISRTTRVGLKVRERKMETLISRYAAGTCFSFQPGIPNIYMVGTEDGHMHKCALSYSEQYLESYNAHTAPIYSINWSPFLPHVFLTCGGDWTVKLFYEDRQIPILKFYSSIAVEAKPDRPVRGQVQMASEKTVYRLKTVYSVEWSPKSSTVFACANHDEVEVWDLSIDILDPIIHYSPPSPNEEPIAPTCVTFARNSECLLVGDCGGNVVVLSLVNMPPPPKRQREALGKIMTVSLNTQLCNPNAAEGAINFAEDE